MFTIKDFAEKVERKVPTIRWWLSLGLLERRKWNGSLYFTMYDLAKAKKIKKEMREKRILAIKKGKHEKN